MAELFLILKYKNREFLNQLATIGRHSRLKIAFITFFAVFFWTALLLLFREGFRFFSGEVNIWELIGPFIFSMFFMILGLMLAFSSAILSYAALYRDPQTGFLLTSPLTPESVFLGKFSEAVVMCSWASLYLTTPMIIAYGIVLQMPWHFYPVGLSFLVPFILLTAVCGTFITMLITTYFAQNRRAILIALGGTILISLLYIIMRVNEVSSITVTMSFRWMKIVTDRLDFTNSELLPSYWISRGVWDISLGKIGSALFFLSLLLSNALFLTLLCYQLAKRKFLMGWSAAHGSLTRRRRSPRGLIDFLSGLCFFLPRETRRLLALDMKNFLRDPVQWLQTLIFFGLLATYIINLRNLKYDQYIPVWRDWVANINLASTSLTLATFSSRFIFPLLSLEGKRFWCLGILPLSRSSIVLSKFNFSFLTSLMLSIPLIVLSDRMLRLSADTLWAHLFILPLICFGLSGLAVGLGARYVDLKSDNPAKIVAGFGGTLNLVLSLIFVVGMIGWQWLILKPMTVYFICYDLCDRVGLLKFFDAATGHNIALALSNSILPMVGAGIFGAMSGLIPLIIGIRYYKKLEF